jgi:hypothetical protein
VFLLCLIVQVSFADVESEISTLEKLIGREFDLEAPKPLPKNDFNPLIDAAIFNTALPKWTRTLTSALRLKPTSLAHLDSWEPLRDYMADRPSALERCLKMVDDLGKIDGFASLAQQGLELIPIVGDVVQGLNATADVIESQSVVGGVKKGVEVGGDITIGVLTLGIPALIGAIGSITTKIVAHFAMEELPKAKATGICYLAAFAEFAKQGRAGLDSQPNSMHPMILQIPSFRSKIPNFPKSKVYQHLTVDALHAELDELTSGLRHAEGIFSTLKTPVSGTSDNVATLIFDNKFQEAVRWAGGSVPLRHVMDWYWNQLSKKYQYRIPIFHDIVVMEDDE